MVNLHNPSDQSLDLTDLPACWLEIQVAENARLGADCFAGVNTLMPGRSFWLSNSLLWNTKPLTWQLQATTLSTRSPQESGEAADVSFDMALR